MLRVHKLLSAVALVLGCVSAAGAQDDIDLSAAVFHGVNVSGWPVTVPLAGAEFQPGESKGIRLIFDRELMNRRWPSAQVWNANPNDPEDGRIQWTFFACVPVGRYHCSGLLEFWGDANGRRQAREWTGAPWLETIADGRNNWQANWAYDRSRFGEMADYVPREGDEVVVMAVAGALRPGTSNHVTVQERTRAFKVRLARAGTFTTPVTNVPQVPSTPTTTTDLAPVYKAIQEQRDYVTQLWTDLFAQVAALTETVAGQGRVLDQTNERVNTLQARPIRATCRGHVNVIIARVPVSNCEVILEP